MSSSFGKTRLRTATGTFYRTSETEYPDQSTCIISEEEGWLFPQSLITASVLLETADTDFIFPITIHPDVSGQVLFIYHLLCTG